MSQKKSAAGIVTMLGGMAVLVCVLWAVLTGAFWPFIPVAVAVGVGTLAAKAAHL